MIDIQIPGYLDLKIQNAVFDFNGTLAKDGKLDECVKEKIGILKSRVDIHILTSDTYGTVAEQCRALGISPQILPSDHAGAEKAAFVRKIGMESTVCIGNGSNDAAMMDLGVLSILVMGSEGCAARTLMKADIVVTSTRDALDLLLCPERIKATLRE